MLPQLSKIKGIHPGIFLRRELKIQGLKGNDLAKKIGVHKQTISAILNKRRGISPQLSIKLSEQFNVDSDYFMLLQSSYDVKRVLNLKIQPKPNLNKIRRVIFWDTTFDKIDWQKNKKAVILRILERGNTKEINEIINFYGKEDVRKVVKSIKNSFLPTFEINVVKFNLA